MLGIWGAMLVVLVAVIASVASGRTFDREGFFGSQCLGNPNAYTSVAEGTAAAVMSAAFTEDGKISPCVVQGVTVPGFTSMRACDMQERLAEEDMSICRIPRRDVDDLNCSLLAHPVLKDVKEVSEDCMVEFHDILTPSSVKVFVDQLTPGPDANRLDSKTAKLIQPTGISKVVDGSTYYLIAAHKAFSYTAPPVSDTDTFFRSMFTTDFNAGFRTLADVLSMRGDSAGNVYANATSLGTLPCTGYLMEAYNEDHSKFPVWGLIDTDQHTWASLAEQGAVFSDAARTVRRAALYASTDASEPVHVGHTGFLTTSKNGPSAFPNEPFNDDIGDYVFMGLSTRGFVSGDSYDVVTFGLGTTCIGFGMSDGSGTGNKMKNYHRRGNYGHCTAMSKGVAITVGRSGGSHAGADRVGFFLLWAKVVLPGSSDLAVAAGPPSYVRSTVPDAFQPGLRYQIFRLRMPGMAFESLLAERSGPRLAEGIAPIDFKGTWRPWGGDALLHSNFGLHIVGFLEVPESRTYVLSIIASNGVSLTIDRQNLLESWVDQPLTLHVVRVELAKGMHTLRLRHFHTSGYKVLRLAWDGPGEPVNPRPAGMPDALTNIIPPSLFSFI